MFFKIFYPGIDTLHSRSHPLVEKHTGRLLFFVKERRPEVPNPTEEPFYVTSQRPAFKEPVHDIRRWSQCDALSHSHFLSSFGY